MRIGIDARELGGRATGVGRYLGALLTEWSAAEYARRHEFVLYAAAPIARAFDARRFATRLVAGAPGTWWEQVRVPRAVRADHLDVWFAPGYTAPLALGLPAVVAIHDVSFAACPQWFRFREGLRRRWITRQSASRACAVITISEFSKRELVERFAVPPDHIVVIPPGLGDCPLPESVPVPPAGTVPTPRVLYVGSIFNRRRVPDLIRAFAPIARAHSDASLDIVGDNRTYPRENLADAIAAAGLDGRIRVRDYVADDELRALYRSARAFAFLSEYEGLGLTPLEALAAGVPPVLLDTSVARESCGDAALYVPADDRAATTRALEIVLFDEAVRARLLAAAPGVLARYDAARSARDTLAVIERCCR